MIADPIGLDSVDLLPSGRRVGWALSLCVEAGEAGGSFRSSIPNAPADRVRGQGTDPERSRLEAAARARRQCRRYCAANRLNRLGTLTYAGDGCHDPRQLRRDVAGFFRALRSDLGGKAFPYLWTSEWHKTGHGLHVHFAVGRFIKRSMIEQAWGLGFVHIKLLGGLPVGTGSLGEARVAAGYLSKYVGKDFDAERSDGLHRYEVAQGFQPKTVQVWGRSPHDAIHRASQVMRSAPSYVWFSEDSEQWQGPPAVWVQWPG